MIGDLTLKSVFLWKFEKFEIEFLRNLNLYDSFVSPRAIELSTAYASVVNITGSFSIGIFNNFQ